MKKTLFVVAACLLCTLSYGQSVITNNYDNPIQNANGTTNNSDNGSEEKMSSGSVIEYYAIDHGFGLAWDLMFNNFLITGSMRSGETNSYITKNDAWSVGVGGHYRYWLGKSLFAEGNAGLQYLHGSVEIKEYGETSSSSNGDFGLFIEPRLGLKLGNLWGTDWCVTAGYRWDFNKFKFDKENKIDYFTIGIGGVF